MTFARCGWWYSVPQHFQTSLSANSALVHDGRLSPWEQCQEKRCWMILKKELRLKGQFVNVILIIMCSYPPCISPYRNSIPLLRRCKITWHPQNARKTWHQYFANTMKIQRKLLPHRYMSVRRHHHLVDPPLTPWVPLHYSRIRSP